MNWSEQLADLNYWAVILATVSTFVLGAAWYSWGVFGKAWGKHVGMKKKDMENSSGMGQVYALTAIGSFVASSALGALMLATGTEGVVEGSIFGFLIGFAFRLTMHVMHNGFERKSQELTLINGMYDMIQLAVIGAILGGLM